MSEIQIITALLEHSPYLLLCAGVLWFGRKKVGVWDQHIRECNQIPKASIMEKLDTIHKGMDEQFDAVADRIAEVKTELATEIDRVDKRYHDFFMNKIGKHEDGN